VERASHRVAPVLLETCALEDESMDVTILFTSSGERLGAGGLVAADAVALTVLISGLAALAWVYGPRGRRVRGLLTLCGELETLPPGEPATKDRAAPLTQRMASSAIAGPWAEFLRQRERFDLDTPDEEAPVRFDDCLAREAGFEPREAGPVMTGLPTLMLGLGLTGTLATLVVELAAPGPAASVPQTVGLALRSLLWGVLLASVARGAEATLARARRQVRDRLSRVVERFFPVITSEEVRLLTADAQLRSQEQNTAVLQQLRHEVREALRDLPERIEQAVSNRSNASSDQQQQAIKDVASAFHYRLEDQLSTLRESTQDEGARPSEDDAVTPTPEVPAAEHGPFAPAAQVASLLGQQGEPGRHGVEDEAARGIDDDLSPEIREAMVASAQRPHASQPTANAVGDSDAGATEDGKSGYSALLHRYEAPRFSLDELSPELRSFDTDAAIERARNAGIPPEGPLEDSAEATGGAAAWWPEDDEAPLGPPGPEEAAHDPPEEGPYASGADERRLRLAQFLRRR